MLTGVRGLLERTRFPLDKRPLQLHNLNLALVALHKAGIQAKVCLMSAKSLLSARCVPSVPCRVGCIAGIDRLLPDDRGGDHGVQRGDGVSSVRAEHIANGDREATLSLLWQLALHLEVRWPAQHHPTPCRCLVSGLVTQSGVVC